jgi:hypothetical protein
MGMMAAFGLTLKCCCEMSAIRFYARAAFAVDVAVAPGFTIAAATSPAKTNPMATVQT